jgi:hypothetical protein
MNLELRIQKQKIQVIKCIIKNNIKNFSIIITFDLKLI